MVLLQSLARNHALVDGNKRDCIRTNSADGEAHGLR